MRNIAWLALGLLLGCVGDSSVASNDAGNDATVDATSDVNDAASDASDAALEAEAGPPTPTGKFSWDAHIGSSGDDVTSAATAFDSKGNLFVVGSFVSQAQFGNAQSLTSLGLADAFVAKYDTTGTCQGVARIGGSTTNDTAWAVAIDPQNDDVVVVGTLFQNSAQLPIQWSVNGGASNQTSNGAFLVKMSNDLSTVKFDQDFARNSSATAPHSLVIGPAGAVIVSGEIQNATQTPFARTGGLVNGSGLGGPSVGFVAQYSSNGAFAFARILSPLTSGPACETFVGGAGFDSQQRIVIAGWALGYSACKYTADYANNQTNNDIDGTNGNVLFVAKYDDTNNGVFQSVKLTAPIGNASGYAKAVAIGPNDEVYAAFEDEGMSFSFAGKALPAASDDGVVFAWDSNAQEKSFFFIGSGTGQNIPYALAVDPYGNVVIGGVVGSNVDFGSGKTITFGGGVSDGFVLKTDPTLANVLWLNAYGGGGNERVFGVAASKTNATGVVGSFDDSSLTVAQGQSITTYGSTDYFALGLAP